MHRVSNQVLGEPSDRQVQFVTLVDGDLSPLEKCLARRQSSVLDFPQRTVRLDTVKEPWQHLEKPDVQVSRHGGVRLLEERLGKWGGFRIGIRRKGERDPGRLSSLVDTEISSLCDVDDQVSMTLRRGRVH